MEHCNNLINPVILKEVGSGLNDKRKKIQELIRMVENNEANRVFVTYRDRLTRFGFHYLEAMFKSHGVEIVVVKDQEKEKPVQEELVEDMMSLIASFSGKLYGLRSKKIKILQEVMVAFHAKNKLDEVKKYLKDHKDDSVPTKDILNLIEKEDTEHDYF
jgi:predicted site-specific integrase-resolvase